MNTLVTQALLSHYRSLAKQRSKQSGEPLHLCLDFVARDKGYAHWKQVLFARQQFMFGSASNEAVEHLSSPGLAFLGFPSKQLGQVREFQRKLIVQGVADVAHNPLKGDVFIDVTIEEHRFQAAINDAPYLVLRSIGGSRAHGDCQLGVASISSAYTNRLEEDPYDQWAVCKYETQARIDLGGLSDAGRRRLALEFGLPVLGLATGLLFSDPWYFYASKAYDALVAWASSHPVKIRYYAANNYLGHWSLAALLDAGIRPTKEHLELIEHVRANRASS